MNLRLAAPWLRYGLIAGIIAFACTLAANTAVTWLQPADLCRTGPLVVPLLSLGALVIFLAMAAAAGFATGRAGSSGADARLAGLLVGAIGGCAVVAMLLFMPGVEHRLQELSSPCPGPGSFGGGSFTFNFGPPLPSGVVIPTPPPQAFTTPPPGAFVMRSPGGVLGEALQMVITIVVGLGLSVSAASVAGLAGRATRSKVGSGEKG